MLWLKGGGLELVLPAPFLLLRIQGSRELAPLYELGQATLLL